MLVPSTSLAQPGKIRAPKRIVSYSSKPLTFQQVKKALGNITNSGLHVFIIFKRSDGYVAGVCGNPRVAEDTNKEELKIDFESVYIYENTGFAFNALLRDKHFAINSKLFADALLNSKIETTRSLVISKQNSQYSALFICPYAE